MKQERYYPSCNWLGTDVGSRLGGINVGHYPLHHFINDCSAPPSESWPLRIDFAGEDIWVRDCRRYRENSDTFAIEYVTEGRFEFIQNQLSYQVTPGTLFLVRRQADSAINCFDCDVAKKLTLALSGPLLEPLLAGFGLDRVDVLTPADPRHLVELLHRGEAILREGGEEKFQRGAMLGFEILMALGEAGRHLEYPGPLLKILRYIDANLREPHTVESLAQKFNLSSSSLHRLFRAYCGDTPINYLIKKRMEVAKRILQLTAEPIKVVAFETGYRNPFYFSSEFRRLTGMSPRDFRLKSGKH